LSLVLCVKKQCEHSYDCMHHGNQLRKLINCLTMRMCPDFFDVLLLFLESRTQFTLYVEMLLQRYIKIKFTGMYVQCEYIYDCMHHGPV
jgi:hypothetical protein